MFTVCEVTNKSEWDNFVKYHFTQSWYWGEFYKNLSCSVWRYGVYQCGKLECVFQCVIIKTKISTYLYLLNGPVFRDIDPFRQDNNYLLDDYKQIFLSVLDKLLEIAKLQKVDFIKIDPLFVNSIQNINFLRNLKFFKSIFEFQSGCRRVIDISLSEEFLYKSISETARYEIRKASKLNYVVLHGDANLFEDFWKIYEQTKYVKSFGSFSKHYYQVQLNTLMSHGEYDIFLLKNETNEVVCGAMVSFYNKVATYLHAASNRFSRNFQYGPKYLLWNILLHAKRKGCIYLDLYGISRHTDNKNDLWYGLSVFKKLFGGYTIDMLETYDYPINYFKYMQRASIDIFRKILKKLKV